MLLASRKIAAVALLALSLGACGDDDDGTGPGPTVNPPLGLTVTAVSGTGLDVTFAGTSGDDSYRIERAEGATGGTFAQVGTLPYAAGTLKYEDRGLTLGTTYRYRVAAVRGTTTSAFTSEISGTTRAPGSTTVDVTTDITTNTRWTAENRYLLKGFIHVANGATLTIDPGTTIAGDFSTLGSALIVLRGARIVAQGTAAQPIVFTSSQPVGQRKSGDWGGLAIIGNATINKNGLIDLEGTGTDGTAVVGGKNYLVQYGGGTIDTDDSGELRYVRVEFAGFAPVANQELNSFTFAGVGSGTKLSFLQALAGLDDAFEWFGGTVDATNLVSYDTGDDHFDMSEGFRGRIQYAIALQSRQYTAADIRTLSGQPGTDPQGVENDGCDGSACINGRNSQPLTTPVFTNFTLVGTGDAATSGASGGVGMMLRRGTGGYYANGIVARWPRGAVSVRDNETFARAGAVAAPDLATSDLQVRNILVAQTPAVFQTGGSSVQNELDLAANAIANGGAVTLQQLFTAFPATVDGATTAAAFDWTPPPGAAPATGGMAAFTGKMQTAAGSVVAGTAFVGAANPAGPKWWQGWTIYARN